jgi:hypothetical protein
MNQLIQWAMFIGPWLTLSLMKREDIKRYMPVGLFTALTGAIIGEFGSTLQFWEIGETAFPFKYTPLFAYGAIPITAMWVFKFTYGRFWTFVFTNAILDIGFAYVIFPWLVSIGVFSFLRSSLVVYLINWGHQMILYGYQMWQDDIFVQKEEANSFSTNLQPVATKPLPEEKDN